MQSARARLSSELGTVVIQVAIFLLALLAFTAFVVDYGVMWASRGQAQTAADAGALAGAVSLAFDSSTDFAGAKLKASKMARENGVWGQQPDVQLSDVTFPPCPPGAPGLPDTCVRVNAFRNQIRGNALPMFFGNLVGVSSQGVRATATAQITGADTTDCLKPWAIVDRWDEFAPGGPEPDYPNPDPDYLPNSTFDKYSDGKGQNPPPEADFYVPPGATSPGTGFQLPADEGRRFAVKVGDNSDTVSSGWFRAIRLPRRDGLTGGSVYRENIESCSDLPASYAAPETVCPTSIGNDDAAYWAEQGCYRVETGNMVGPTQQGIATLIARDPGASYVPGTGIVGSTFSPATKSPRVVPIGVMNIDKYMAQDPSGSNPVVRMENIYGFFVEGMGDVAADGSMTLSSGGKSVIGRLMTIPATGSSKLTNSASFMRSIILVR